MPKKTNPEGTPAPDKAMPPAKKSAPKKRKRAKVTVDGHAIYVSGRTKKELEENKRLVRERYIGGTRPREITFHDLVIEWFDTFKRPYIRTSSTLASWRSVINNHILPCFSPHQMVQAVRRADLQRCLDQTAGMSYIIANLVCSVFRHVFEYAMAEGMITVNPAYSLTKPQPPEPECKDSLTIEQEDALLLTASRHPYGLMIYLLYYLGVRRGEMLGLRWEDFDWQKKAVHIQRDIDFNTHSSSVAVVGDLKTKAANRWVPVPDELIEILAPLRSLPHMYLIADENGNPLNFNRYRTRWNRLMQDAGFLELKDSYREKAARLEASGQKVIAPNFSYDYRPTITAHWLRHHYITAKVEAGERAEVIMSIVGHADYSTTINIYTHIKNRVGVEPSRLSRVFLRYVA